MTTAAQTPHRTSFRSISSGGLNWDSLPLRLFAKGNAKFWDPASLDFSQDAADWQGLNPQQKDAALDLCTNFIAGEEAVTEDIQPFIRAMGAEGRLGDEMYLTQFAFEEAKHTQVFRLWLDALGLTEDLNERVAENPGYRKLFYEELPEALHALDADPGPASQVFASVTYNHVIEGSLALTGYFAWNRICAAKGIFPGMQQIIKRIGDDERRHMAWGTFTCRRHVAADDAHWQRIQDRIEELTPHTLELITFGQDRYEEPPFGIEPDELTNYATDRLSRRLSAIESARGTPLAKIDTDSSPEELEEKFGREDAASIAAAAR